MSTIRTLGALLICSFAASPLLAQLDENYIATGRRTATPIVQEDPDIARRMLATTARCIYRRHSDIAQRFLESSDPLAVDFDGFGIRAEDVGDELDISECLGEAMTAFQLKTSMKMSWPALRVSLAEEAYLAANDEPVAIDEGSEEILSGRYFVNGPSEPQARGLGAFADCVVFHAPNEADELLRTSHASSKEDAAARALVPALSQCLVEGQEVNLTVAGIREFAADGLWSRSTYAGASVAEVAE